MSWVTFIWALVIGASATMALPHLLIGLKGRVWENLFFAVAALAVAGVACGELAIMHSRTTEEIGRAQQWTHLPLFFLLVSVVGFVRFYFGTGRLWLGLATCGARLLMLVINFAYPPNLNFSEIIGLRYLSFLGETVAMPEGIVSPWTRFGQFSSLLVIAFVVDASIALWRRGTPEARRRAVVVGGSVSLFILLGAGLAALVHANIIKMPYLVSFPFLCVIVAMGFELSYDILRAAQTARELRTSEAALRESDMRMTLAASAANLGLWVWDIQEDAIWSTEKGRELFGFNRTEPLNFALFAERVHPDDRAPVRAAVAMAIENGGDYYNEHRVLVGTEPVRWVAARGRIEFTADHRPLRMRGVSIDITARKQAAAELQERRSELAHLSRVTMLGGLSGSLAHELNQPLAIILSNAQAAQRLLVLDPPDVAEVRDILADIVAEDQRAGEVIKRLRTLLKRGETTLAPLSLNEAIKEVLRLVHADLIERGVTVERALMAGLPPVSGDRVQLQQVVLNLALNAADAMSANAPGSRRLHLTTARGDRSVRLSVRDEGCGLPADAEQLFAPFFTTKSHGLGMGLAICRSIVTAHGGQLWAEPHPERGAVFHLELPAPPASPA